MRSDLFDDVYFSADDGYAEAQHVFLGGCGLPEAWVGRAHYTIAETGFGTGLNMLAVWALFDRTRTAGQHLHLISFERYPLSVADIRTALSRWTDVLGPYCARLCEVYPPRIAGWHTLALAQHVTLTLIFGDVNTTITGVTSPVDAWFLDGFAPAKNPDMWTQALFENMARLSVSGTRVATFTAAGFVRRGLAAAGFNIQKLRGYGRKRDMVVGRMDDHRAVQSPPHTCGPVAVIGAGIAGLSLASMLQAAGVSVTVFEQAAQAGAGASGGVIGLINPRLQARAGVQSAWGASCFSEAQRFYSQLAAAHPEIGWRSYGAVHLSHTEDRARKHASYASHLDWHSDHMQLLSAAAASDVAGIALSVPALFYPQAACVRPRAVCAALAAPLSIFYGTAMTHIERAAGGWCVTDSAGIHRMFAHVVMAQAMCATNMPMLAHLPLRHVRGQVSVLAADTASGTLRTNVCYGGYVTPADAQGLHVCGATFQPWLNHSDILADDDARNIANLAQSVPALQGLTDVRGAWAAVRATSPDHMPIVGALDDGLWLSLAHGSHGLSSGPLAARLLCGQILGYPQVVDQSVITSVSPRRFLATPDR